MLFTIRYKEESVYVVEIEAENELEAKQKWQNGEYEDEIQVDTLNAEMLTIRGQDAQGNARF